MGWILLVLLLIAAAFGVLGLVVKATIFVVLTVVISTILLAYIAYALVKRQARKVASDLDRRLQPPSQPPTQDYRY
jgi:peptidoglycan/LPS O-acetylase OafA/YrhL